MKYPGAREYEMHYVSVELDSNDIDIHESVGLTTRERWYVLQYMAQLQVVTFGVTRGFIPTEHIQAHMAAVRKLVGDELLGKLKANGI